MPDQCIDMLNVKRGFSSIVTLETSRGSKSVCLNASAWMGSWLTEQSQKGVYNFYLFIFSAIRQTMMERDLFCVGKVTHFWGSLELPSDQRMAGGICVGSHLWKILIIWYFLSLHWANFSRASPLLFSSPVCLHLWNALFESVKSHRLSREIDRP